NDDAFAEGLKKVKLSAAYTLREDETASLTNIAAAAPHYIESWGDVQMKKGHYSIMQPTIRPLFNTKQFQEGLLTWLGKTASYYDYLQSAAAGYTNGKSWYELVHDCFVATEITGSATALSDFNGAA